MSVIHREPPIDLPHPIRSAALEDILRDAACLATEDEAPQGLAYRALARQIAAQEARKNQPSGRAKRKPIVGLWFRGLSAGTLTGAAAAILAIAYLNGNAFRISPEAALLPTLPSQEIGTKPVTVDEIPSRTEGLPGPQRPIAIAAASLVTAGKESAPEIRLPAHLSSERETPSRSAGWNRPREQNLLPMPRPRSSVASNTSSPARANAAPPVAQWKTEPFEQTEVQLVTAAYTPEPASGGYASGSDHIQLTPLKMRASFEHSETDLMADPSLPQY